MPNIRKNCPWIRWPAQHASVREKLSESLTYFLAIPIKWRLGGLVAVACFLLTLPTSPAYADAADQARRMTHFQWLQARGIFQSMGVVNGVPQLVLGSQRTKADNNAMAVFCRIIFDYFVENNSAVTNMVVIDSITGNQFAVVDSRGFHLT